MEFTNEMIKKAQKAASAEELIQIAKADGVSLSAEDAEKYFSFLHESKELTEDELEAVSGGELDGKGEKDPPSPKYKEGQTVWIYYFSTLNYLKFTIKSIGSYSTGNGYLYFGSSQVSEDDYYYLEKECVSTSEPK